MDLKKTLSLFETNMPIRVNFKDLDAKMYDFYESNNIFNIIFDSRKDKEKYTLHDGPPYANGPIHLGHAYNKIMKDISIRSHIMMGYNAYVTPGWDCHGLPIEHKVMQENKNYNRIEMKQLCRLYADDWVNNQKKSFKKLAIIMDFENPYKTMSFDYQANILRSFGKLIKNGFINRSNKTIPWCCGCQTTLATAEIEYRNRKDPSLYVLFEVNKDATYEKYFKKVDSVFFVIWTTTPWTLPLNRGVMIKKNAQYVLVLYEVKYLIIGKDCLSHFTFKTDKEYTIIQEFSSIDLVNLKIKHPFENNFLVPVICDDSVELGEGTACVHTAPGCGPIDYEIGIKNRLEIYSPISEDGVYTYDVKIPELVGMKITEAQGWVITELQKKDLLWQKGSINHSYPHCWRSKEGLIFRATPQWFCNLEKDNFKEKIMNAIDEINFYPFSSKSFLRSTILNRWEWCISRQRAWGVPIVAFINKATEEYWTSDEFINYVASQIEKYGVEYWDTVSISDLKDYIPVYINEKNWRKETDILDVWFDSGISHFAVLEKNGRFPADVYLEGVDQHRGWFQSSLLTSIALTGKIPMKSIVSCGHTVDEKGQKMSKSLGNVISPEEIIKSIGLDGLRLWVSSVNLGGDIVVGKKVFDNIAEVYRKLRNSCRFAVQNIVDFDFETDAISFNKLGFINQIVVQKMFLYQNRIIDAYRKYNFTDVFHTLIEISTSFLSSFYFDTLKDILYCDNLNSYKRRSAQTVLHIILESLTRLIAPILPYTAEDITNYYKSAKGKTIANNLFYDFSFLSDFSNSYDVDKIINQLMSLREDVFKSTELLREKNIIKQSIEGKIHIQYQDSCKHGLILSILNKYISAEEFDIIISQLLCVSDVKLENIKESLIIKNENNKGFFEIIAEKHDGKKCERCWKYFYSIANECICSRCKNVIDNI